MADHFTSTSLEPYHRHQYKVYYKNSKSKILDYYDDVWKEWASGSIKLIEVVDKKVKKTNTGRGFK